MRGLDAVHANNTGSRLLVDPVRRLRRQPRRVRAVFRGVALGPRGNENARELDPVTLVADTTSFGTRPVPALPEAPLTFSTMTG